MAALVGYTNSGKSTLLNSLSSAGVLAKNEMFSTLDPTTRKINLPGNHTILLTDTVGFIRKLPPTLMNAFRATLEELTEADLMLHVIDINSHNADRQYSTVEDILKDMNIENIPRISVFNKIDLLFDQKEQLDGAEALKYIEDKIGEPAADAVLVSAEKRWGLDNLLNKINEYKSVIESVR